MNRPGMTCDETTFRTLYKLCARLTRKMPYALYLAALHAQDADKAELQCKKHLHSGEVLCRTGAQSLYILLFAYTEEEANAALAPLLASLPGSTVRVNRITQRLKEDPAFDE